MIFLITEFLELGTVSVRSIQSLQAFIPHTFQFSSLDCLVNAVQVLARFLGERYYDWQHPENVLPFRKHQSEKQLAASELKHAHKLPRAPHFDAAMKVYIITIIPVFYQHFFQFEMHSISCYNPQQGKSLVHKALSNSTASRQFAPIVNTLHLLVAVLQTILREIWDL